ncbi:MAG: DUF4070 domain-containing protein [Eubacteriales bacterium]|nr:DUF4070 domain-containing protein [Eubacteriales bacterium]
MRILLVYPEFPDTFWSYKHALKFISKKAVYPPLGLLTVAAMLPENWEKKLIDMNVAPLQESDLVWADLVFISAMSVQCESVNRIITACKKAGVGIVAGGPLFTACHEKFDSVDFLVLNEAEATLSLFLEDLDKGCPKHLYTSDEWPDISKTPGPLWELIDMKKYSAMNIQYSRGCPFNCEFCDIVVLFGHKPRLKSTKQVIDELQALYDFGWRDSVFFVDDNFIGNGEKLKKEVLPAIIGWSEQNGYPFSFHTEASINLSDDIVLMQLMVKAGFDMVFIGIESPHEESLAECNKYQNKGRNLIECVDKIQKQGLEVQGGFILGFDNDPDSIFDTLIWFLQHSGIIVAMVGLLNAPRGTKLFQRLKKEKRIISDFSGDNTDFSMNFKPKMEYNKLIKGYSKVVETIYSPKYYYKRIMQYLKKHDPAQHHHSKIQANGVRAFVKSIFYLGIAGKERFWYWKLFFYTLFHEPSQLSKAMTYAICGYHFRKIYKI